MAVGQRVFWLWRLFGTALAFAVFGVAGVLLSVLAAPILLVLPGGRSARALRARRLVHWLFKAFIYFMAALGLLRWRVEGMAALRRPGLLILANHPTLLDVVFVVAFIPNATCLVKSRLRKNPAMRVLISLAGYIANDEGSQLLSSVSTALGSGSTLVIFPEGTRTRSGQPIALQRGAANIALRCGVDITPLIIRCDPPTLSKEHKWYHIPDRTFTMTFVVLGDIPIAGFADSSAALSARKLTRYLEHFFTEETRLHVH